MPKPNRICVVLAILFGVSLLSAAFIFTQPTANDWLPEDTATETPSPVSEAERLLEEKNALDNQYEELAKEYRRNPQAFEADDALMAKWQEVCTKLAKPTNHKPED